MKLGRWGRRRGTGDEAALSQSHSGQPARRGEQADSDPARDGATAAETYDRLKEGMPQFLDPPDAFDSFEWELEQLSRCGALEDAEATLLSQRHQERLRQGEVVLELLNNKVRDNYASFVEGMNKIQAVGTCSEQTTQICDTGKHALRRAKEDMVKRALEVTQAARRKRNVERMSSYLRQMQELLAQHRTVRALMSRGDHAAAVLAIVRGMGMARAGRDVDLVLRREPGGSLGLSVSHTTVTQVKPGGPGHVAGVRVGMELREVGGKPVHDHQDVGTILRGCGTEVAVKLCVPDLLGVNAVTEMVAAWEEDKSKCAQYLKQGLQAQCKQFDPDSFRTILDAFVALNKVQQSGEQLRHHWMTVVRRMAHSSVRPFVAKYTQSRREEDQVDALPFRELAERLRPEDSRLASLSLLSAMATLMWTFNAMMRWLSERESGRQWHAMLLTYRDDFWGQVQQHVLTFLQAQRLRHLLQVADLFSHVSVFSHFSFGFSDAGPGATFLHDAKDILASYLRNAHQPEVISRLRRSLATEEFWGAKSLDGPEAKQGLGNAETDRRRGEVAARYFTSADVGDNPFRDAKSSGGFEALDVDSGAATPSPKSARSTSPAGGSPQSEQQVMTHTSMALCREVRRYADVADLYPSVADAAHQLAQDVVRVYSYIVFANFCHTQKEQSYYPEHDKDLPAQVHESLNVLAETARRCIPQEQAADPKEQPSFLPPAAQARVWAKLTNREQVYGLKERLIATESVLPLVRTLEEELPRFTERVGDPAFTQAARVASDQLSFLARHQAKVMAKRLSLLMLPLDGVPKSVSEGKWEPKTAETEPSAYVSTIMAEVHRFGDDLTRSTAMLPGGPAFCTRMWKYAVENIWYTLVEGYARVKKCNDNGRSLMTVDLKTLHHNLKAQAGADVPSTEVVEDYIKAFWKIDAGGDGYIDWLRNAHVRYTQKQLLALLSINSGLLDGTAKRRGRQELIRRAEEELQRLDHRDRAVLDVL